MVESQSSDAKGIDNSAERISGNEGGYVIVITRWNEGIVNGLLAGAQQALQQMGIADDKVRVVTVPGAFEVPLACQAGKPVAFGVLTVDTLEQAVFRSSDDAENKGVEAAMSAVEMVNLLSALRS
jgi:6,7-dimethyl-8-ribityllumazine synthase